MTGLVTDITRGATKDGPGIRTVVFLKGCPLHCSWCHNPECISPKPEPLFYPEKCIGCGKCAQGCYTGARVTCGEEKSVEQVMGVVLADRHYYGATGGITVSGGEPLLQKNFTKAIALAAREAGIHTAVETSLAIWDEKTLRAFDLILFDLKLPDDARHLAHTGVTASHIKENIRKAAELGIPMYARTPVIPGVNGDAGTIREIAGFLRQFPAVKRYELLAYHPLGLSKAAALGRPQTKFEVPTKTQMEELNKYAFLR